MTWQQWCKKPGWGWSAVAVLAAAGLWVAWPPRGPADAAPPASGSVTASSRFPYVGAVSCAAAACHNANGASGEKFSEYTTWISDDPHHRAYEVLFNEDSRQIGKRLGIRDVSKDGVCLSCHVHAACRPAANSDQAALLETGVGCESCHGPAGLWKREHYLPGWRDLDPQVKARQFGMTPTRDLVSRAKGCVGCHVGAGDRDVNHDLIAAGHPRLYFEFSAFLTKMPKHWQERNVNTGKDFQVRAWAIGQVASAQAALELLAYRADETHHKPWPEFAEYNCFACHHDLQGQSWRQRRRIGAPELGTYQWGTWYFAAESLVPDVPPGVVTKLAILEEKMRKRPPNRKAVRALAQGLVQDLDAWMKRLEQTRFGRADVMKRFARIAQDEAGLAGKHWDGAVHVYLGLAALYQALNNFGAVDAAVKDDLNAMRNQLDFPPDKPGTGKTAPTIKHDSPKEMEYVEREKAFKKALQLLRDRTGK